MSQRLIALVGVENCAYSFDTLFSYVVPESLCEFVCVGSRIMVPFGNSNKLRQGFVFDLFFDESEQSDDVKVKSIYSVLDSRSLLTDEMIKLAKWIKDRCFCTYFTAAKALLPGGMCLKTEKTYLCAQDIPPELYNSLNNEEKRIINYLRKKKDYVRESLILKNIGLDKNSILLNKLVKKGCLIESGDAFSRVKDLAVQMIRLSDRYINECEIALTDKQQSVVNVLKDVGAASVQEIVYFTGVSDSVVRTLISKGFCEAFSAKIERNIHKHQGKSEYRKPVLSNKQNQVFNSLKNAYTDKSHKSALLYGVTGSGKTSVYLEMIDFVLEQNKSVIVLVPEISLTPQTFSIFADKYGKDVAVLHSALSLGERHDEWKRIADGKVKVVIGTRSAVFAPLDNIGLIIIDEEQEHTYKSEMNPRYNAKDVARFRCAYHSAFLLLASATPSIETYAKAVNGQMLLCELSERFGNAVLPDVYTVDMTNKSLLSAFFAISDPLAEEIQKNIDKKEQTILLVNRRGYNTFVVCTDCKNVITCPKCSISMTYHSANNRLMCHYCGYSIPFVSECPSCGAENIRYSGYGTQKVEQELKLRFPDARILRMDADTTVTKDSHSKHFSAFADGEYDILIGTQMVAKGLDFPNVTLVGVTSADKELYNNDFRSAERTFDLITQVVGRAGRGKKKGRAVIQSVAPDNHIINIASRQDYKTFYKSEINMRRALIYPPFCDICEIGFTGLVHDRVKDCAIKFFDAVVEANQKDFSDQKIIILGPMSPRVSKVNSLYRQRILIKCKNSEKFRKMIDIVLKNMMSSNKDVVIYVDINPEKLS